MSFTVGRLAKLSGLSVRSLHHYDEIGLLVPSQRSESGYRLYSQQDVERLYRIQALRHLGWSLAQVQATLRDGGASISDLLEEQLAALDQQMAQTQALRSRIAYLHEHLSQRGELSPVEWLAAVEVFSHYDKHLTQDELGRLSLVPEHDKDEWRSAYAAAASATARGLPPDTEEAQAIAKRWVALTWRQVGGDLRMALKLKSAYKQDAGIRASMSAISGVDAAVMHFIWAAIEHKHVATFGQHFSKEELARIDFSDECTLERAHIVAALDELLSARVSAQSDAVQGLIDDWQTYLSVFVKGDLTLKTRFEAALGSDPNVRKLWLMSDELHQFIDEAWRSRLATNQ